MSAGDVYQPMPFLTREVRALLLEHGPLADHPCDQLTECGECHDCIASVALHRWMATPDDDSAGVAG